MSTPSVTITFPAPDYEFEEVWGMGNKNFHDGTDPMVRVVKHSEICPELNFML